MPKCKSNMSVAEYLGGLSADPKAFAKKFDHSVRDKLKSMGINNASTLYRVLNSKCSDAPSQRTLQHAFKSPSTMSMRTYSKMMEAFGSSLYDAYDILDYEDEAAREARCMYEQLYDDATERMLSLICAFTRFSADRQELVLRMVQAAGQDAEGPHKVACDKLRVFALSRLGRSDLISS